IKIDNKYVKCRIMQFEDGMKGSFCNSKIVVSFEQLFDFFDEVAKGKVTEKTNKVQQWITYSNTSGILNTVTSHQNYEKLSNKLKLATTDDYKEIRNNFYRDKGFKKEYRINNVYTFNNEKTLKPNHKR